MQAEIRNLTNEEYHASEGLSSSSLKLLLSSPKKYYHRYILGNKQETTEAMDFGTKFHTYLLERDEFRKKYYIVKEKLDARTKRYQEILKIAKGKDLFKIKTLKDLQGMKRSTFNVVLDKENSIIVKDFFEAGVAEQSIFWVDEETGITLKARPDWVNPEVKVIVDPKTINDASADNVSKVVYSMGYFIQAALAVDGLFFLTGEKHKFFNTFTEKKAPYCARAGSYNDALLDMGRSEIRKALNIYVECKKNNYWPDFNEEGLVDLYIPYWAENKITYEEEYN